MPRPTEPPEGYSPSNLAAAGTAAAVLLLYLVTLAPTTAMWDAGEYMAAAYTMGVAHPPGNPLFILLGRSFSVLPIGPDAAVGINVLAALCSALAAGIWFLVAERILATWIRDRWQRVIGAAIAPVTGATAFTVWNQSVVNEKVYTITLLGLAVVSWIALRWLDTRDERRQSRLLILAAYVLVLGYTNHMGGLLAAPALAILVLAARPATLLRWRTLAMCAVVGALGFSPYLTQVIRASHAPAINMGATSACEEGPRLSCLLDPETKRRFSEHLSRDQYAKPSLLDRQAPFGAQLGMYWLYFKWQWVRDLAGQAPAIQSFVALLFLGVGLYGGLVHWRRDQSTFWYVATLQATLALGLVFYMNFKLGFTQAVLAGHDVFSRDVSEVRDRDYFFLWSFSAWSIWLAVGLTGVWKSLAASAAAFRPSLGGRPAIAHAMAAPVLLLALVPLVANRDVASRRGETFTADWAHDVLNTVEPNGILISFGDNDTYPVWYAQEVEKLRRDVTPAVATLLGTDWYAATLLLRPLEEFDPQQAPLFAGWTPAPNRPLLDMTTQQVREVPSYVMLDRPSRFERGGLSGTVEPGLLTRDQILVLSMLRDSFPHRPVYFTSPGGYLDRLGLADHLVREGLLYRLRPHAELERDGIARIPGLGAVDVDRTLALWDTVYRGRDSLAQQGRWVDQPSVGIPLLYLNTGIVLATALEHQGRTAEADRVAAQVMETARGAGLERFVTGG